MYELQSFDVPNYSLLNETKVLLESSPEGPLKYYMNNNITIYSEPLLILAFYIYDMKSITPEIKFEFQVKKELIKDILRGETE